jgi:hypothetical protein
MIDGRPAGDGYVKGAMLHADPDAPMNLLLVVASFFVALALVEHLLGPWVVDVVSFAWPDVRTAEYGYLPGVTPVALGPLLGAILAPVAAFALAAGLLRGLWHRSRK